MKYFKCSTHPQHIAKVEKEEDFRCPFLQPIVNTQQDTYSYVKCTAPSIEVSIEEYFFRRCERHDWYYHMSDYNKYFYQGSQNEAALKEMYAGRVNLEKIYHAWSDYMFSGEAFNTPELPRPVLEDFLP